MDPLLPMDSFRVHGELNPVVWDDEKMRPQVREKLMEVAERFKEHLGVDFKVRDVWLTGSLANYNWSQFSDVDLHLLLDFKDVDEDEDLVRELMTAKKDIWNERHDVKIGPFEVELYAQDVDEPHEATGVYSIKNDKWLRKPDRKKPNIDLIAVKRKAKEMMRRIDRSLDNSECGHDCLERTMDRVKKMRQCGLEHGGEFSTENLAFKVLRRNGYLEKLTDQRRYRLDQELSMRVARGWLLSKAHGQRG
jgi:predicted nucleotidyltransferase